MAIADGNRYQLRYVEEANWGITPATALRNFRCTSANLKQVNQTVVSEEIRSDRQITDLIRVGASASASIAFELSYGSLDDFLEGALGSDWLADNDFDGAQEGADLLVNGTSLKSYTLEGHFSNVTQFLSLTGCRIGSLSLTMRTGEIVTGTMELVGKIAALTQATTGTGEPVAAPSTDVFSAVDLAGVEEGGDAIELIAIELTIDAGARQQQVLGEVGLRGVGLGRFNVTGTFEAYFENGALMNKYLAHAASSLGWSLSDTTGNALAFSVDRLKFSDGEIPVEGNDTDPLQRFPFQALMDPTTGRTLRITRIDAA